MAKKISVYFPEPVLGVLDVAQGGLESFSGRVGFLTCAAAEIAAANVPTLPKADWLALLDANNSTQINYDLGAQHAVSGMLLNVADADVAHLGADGQAVAERVAALPWVQQFAVFEIVRKFWRGGQVREGETWGDVLARLGARVETGNAAAD